jgi:hypothetical protein
VIRAPFGPILDEVPIRASYGCNGLSARSRLSICRSARSSSRYGSFHAAGPSEFVEGPEEELVSVAVHRFVGRVAYVHEPAQAHFFQFRAIPTGPDERLRQAIDIIRRRQSPVDSRLHDLADPSSRRPDDWNCLSSAR